MNRWKIRWTDNRGEQFATTLESAEEAEELREAIENKRGFTLEEFEHLS